MRLAYFIIYFFCFSLLNFSAPVSASTQHDISFISLADIHFDPFISCNKITPCTLILQLQQAPINTWGNILNKVETAPSFYGQDTNYPLLVSALADVQKVVHEKQPRFILLLGDLLGHDYKQKYIYYTDDKTAKNYALFVKKTMAFLALQFKKTFPKTDVYYVVGNNDSYQDDYEIDANDPFFNDMGKIWSLLINDNKNRQAMRQSFTYGGYYSVTMGHLKLLILDSVLLSNKTQGHGQKEAVQKQFAWLAEELTAAEDQQQKVIIALHIPIGIDVYSSLNRKPFTIVEFWQTPYADQFEKEIKQHNKTIMGVLFGHIHMDWFQRFTDGLLQNVPFSSTPAISPLFGNNPAYKIYSYDPDQLELKNYTTYYLDLEKSHAWSVEYRFNDVYQPHCTQCTLREGMSHLETNGELAAAFKNFFCVGTHRQPIDASWMPHYWCALVGLNPRDYRLCIDGLQE